MPLWVLLSRRTGKLGAYLLSSLLFGLGVASMFFGAAGSAGLLYLQMIVVGTAYAGIQALPLLHAARHHRGGRGQLGA